MNHSINPQAPCDRNRGRRGATIVEFAFTFLLFVIVLLTITEMGRGMWTYAMINHATRQAGRFCMVRGAANPATTTEVRGIVDKACKGLELSDITLTTQWEDADDGTVRADPSAIERGDILQVKVTYPFQLVTGNLIVPDGVLQMGAKTRMVVAN